MVDIAAQLGAVSRELRIEEVDGEPSNVQVLEQTYHSPIDDVWDAVTSAERIPRWFMPISGELRHGGRYQLEGNAGGEVLECEPPADGAARFKITWGFGGGISWVTVRLTGKGDDTTLELEHVARVADIPDEMWQTYGPGATGVGWDSGLLGLATYLSADGSGITPDQAEAWMVSDEGKQFARGSADAWAATHVAVGADPEAAARAADATWGFFTGSGQ
ncbi:SRPBCC family protein [Propionibacteriaceae bacterium Y2011]|uniref:SRPBCC family protein n=1 Tax=Microlunatus sp. Y2014 TaxID=3418488 RepID=UPI003B4B7B40